MLWLRWDWLRRLSSSSVHSRVVSYIDPYPIIFNIFMLPTDYIPLMVFLLYNEWSSYVIYICAWQHGNSLRTIPLNRNHTLPFGLYFRYFLLLREVLSGINARPFFLASRTYRRRLQLIAVIRFENVWRLKEFRLLGSHFSTSQRGLTG